MHLVYYSTIVVAFVFGIWRYKKLDRSMRTIVILIIIIAITESISYVANRARNYDARCATYHIYNIVEMCLQTLFFIYAIKPNYYRKLIAINFIVWPLFGLLNILFLQPLNQLNNNMLMLESFATITMSLYFIYWLLRNGNVKNIFKNSHFIVAALLLILWSSTFFYWAFIKILYHDFNNVYETIDNSQNIVNIVVYAGIAVVLFLYKPQKLKTVENN